MYARVTNYKMKPGSREAATKVMEGLREQILALPGIVKFINVMKDDGTGVVVALSTNQTMDEETAARVQALWSNFMEFLESPPERGDFHVVADWTA